jgi:hypothetical protein
MTRIFAALHALASDRERGSSVVELSLVGVLVVAAGLAAATLFDGNLFRGLK